MNISTPLSLAHAEPCAPLRTDETIAVIGLGYVGLPVAVGFARHFANVTGFDISQRRVAQLHSGFDATREITKAEVTASTLEVTAEASALSGATFFVVTVPTPIDKGNRPDLSPLESACRTIGPHLTKGAVVVFESTVYPGVTEDFCGPILSETSGLACGRDFTLGYSPERINPGDTRHRLETIVKVVSGQNAETLQRVADVYAALVPAGIHRAPSIRVAEAAKVIENTQRDVNIALMNEIAIICDRMDINSHDVLQAAGTKWNFLPFTPGLVGGHCIGVDPYYLTAKAEELGYHPEVILSGRRVNDSMGGRIAEKAVKMLSANRIPLAEARVGVLGLTFKENVPDLRNSKTFDVLEGLAKFGVRPLVHDAMVAAADIPANAAGEWCEPADMPPLDLLILAVPHRAYVENPRKTLLPLLDKTAAVIDIRAALDRKIFPDSVTYWNL